MLNFCGIIPSLQDRDVCFQIMRCFGIQKITEIFKNTANSHKNCLNDPNAFKPDTIYTSGLTFQYGNQLKKLKYLIIFKEKWVHNDEHYCKTYNIFLNKI